MRNGQSNQQTLERQEVSEEHLEERYADMLDQSYPVFRCGQTEYAASATLKLVDEIAYRLGFNEFIAQNWEEHPFREGYYISKR